MEQENSLIPEEEIKNPEILETSTNDEPVVTYAGCSSGDGLSNRGTS